ncbi:hypothetical protein [Bacteroides acidifaciens]|uniref:hypothetical protein n=1 Tax=Bacteroides acidifaciens TaxID=85831 RepID=UPI0025B73D2F|nr:hypothetical protein [Bacteroides acidifaciens]
MSNENNICPNCGANIHKQGLGFVCDYCGSTFIPEDYSKIYPVYADTVDIQDRYEYLKRNEQHISISKIVTCEKNINAYRISSNPVFYTNDGNFRCILTSSCTLKYENDGNTETLLLTVHSSKNVLQPIFSILLDEEYIIDLCFDRWEDKEAVFRIDFSEFKEICESSIISVSCNLMDSLISNYDEFIPYCCRFYNVVFDKCKYLYSIHKHLISDQNGK